MDELVLVSYVVGRLGCVHPFVVSRVLALVELEWFRGRGEWLTGFRYRGFMGVFYIEGLKELIESSNCFRRVEREEGHGCIEYICEPPRLDDEVKRLIDEVVERVRDLSYEELNKLVTTHPLYSKLFEK